MTWNRPDYSRRVTRSPVIIREDVEESLFLGNVSICTSHSSQNPQGLDCSPFRKVFYQGAEGSYYNLYGKTRNW